MSEKESIQEKPFRKGLFATCSDNPLILGTVLFATLSGFLFGYDQGVAGVLTTQENFGSHFPRIYSDSNFKGWFVASLLLLAWFGSLVGGPVIDLYGRRLSFIMASVIFVIGSTFQCWAANLAMLFAGRCIAGFAIGALTLLGPMFISEISPSHLRGAFVVLQQLSITFGILVSYWIDYGSAFIGSHQCAPGTAYNNGSTFNPYVDVPHGGCTGQKSSSWRIPLGLQIAPGFLLGVGMIYLPETPRFLMFKGNEDDALSVLSRIRKLPSGSKVLQHEFLEIKGEVLFERHYKAQHFGSSKGIALMYKEYKNLFFVYSNFKRVFIGSALMFFQQFMGCNAMIYYAPTIFNMLGLDSNTTSLLATGVYGIVNFISTFIPVFIIDRVGRKKLLMSGAIGTGSSLIIVGAILGKYGDTISNHKSAGYAAMAFIYIYDIHFSYSFAPIGWVLPSEIFSIGIRSKAMSITTSSTWMNNFIIGQITPRMMNTMKYGTFLFFAAFCLIAFFFTWFIIPETKLKSLEEMDQIFGDDEAYQNKHDFARIREELQLNAEQDAFKGVTEHCESV